jgi:hypothetical protein
VTAERPGAWIDYERTCCLCDTGHTYAAAVVVTEDGTEDFLLIEHAAVNKRGYNRDCLDAPHEQVGPLPIEFVRRITISRCRHLCGRPTKATGRPCRIEVTRPGEPCGLHRTPNPTKGTRHR